MVREASPAGDRHPAGLLNAGKLLMCVVSMIMDHYRDKWDHLVVPGVAPPPAPPITAAEIEEFRRLLERARDYDRKNSEPDCELKEKRDAIKKIADLMGVKIDFV